MTAFYGSSTVQWYDSGGGYTPVGMASDNTWGNPGYATGAPTYAVGANYNTAGDATNTCGTRNDTYFLLAKGFDFSSIPDGSTLTSVVLSVRYAFNVTSGAYANRLHAGIDNTSQLAVSGSNVTTEATTHFDVTLDLLAAGVTLANLKDANFCAGIAAQRTSTGAMTIGVDAIWIDATWTTPKSGSDTGSAAEAITDRGLAQDEPGSAAEGASQAVTAGGSDAATAADDGATLTADLTGSETDAGAEDATKDEGATPKSGDDSGAFAEDVTLRELEQAETGTGGDDGSPSAAQSGSDTGAAAEAVTDRELAQPETATAADGGTGGPVVTAGPVIIWRWD